MAWGKKKEDELESTETALDFGEQGAAVDELDDDVPVCLGYLGPSVHIKGEVTGHEDMTIDGRIDGKITLEDHDLVVAMSAHICGEIHARNVVIMGEVVGDVFADDRVEVTDSGVLQGDITSPRVALCEGARFKGNVDTDLAQSAGKNVSATEAIEALDLDLLGEDPAENAEDSNDEDAPSEADALSEEEALLG